MAPINSKQRFISFLESQWLRLTIDNGPLAVSFSGRSIDDLSRLRGVPFAAITFYGAGAGGSEDFAIYHNCFWPEDKPIYGFTDTLLPRTTIEINPKAFIKPIDGVIFVSDKSSKRNKNYRVPGAKDLLQMEKIDTLFSSSDFDPSTFRQIIQALRKNRAMQSLWTITS